MDALLGVFYDIIEINYRQVPDISTLELKMHTHLEKLNALRILLRKRSDVDDCFMID